MPNAKIRRAGAVTRRGKGVDAFTTNTISHRHPVRRQNSRGSPHGLTDERKSRGKKCAVFWPHHGLINRPNDENCFTIASKLRCCA